MPRLVQLRPPLLVVRMVPDPTATQVLLLGQLMPDRLPVVPDSWLCQDAPPSVEATMAPAWPTATQWLLSTQLTLASVLVVAGDL